MALFKPRRVMQHSIADHVNGHLAAIKELFPEAKLTLVVRSDLFEKPFIFTNDQPGDAIAAIRQMTERTANVLVH